jgi:hypothetical protein
MSQVSVPVRVLALVGLLSALAVGAWTMTAGRNGSPGSGDASAVAPLPAVHRAKTVAAALNAHNKVSAAGKEAAAAPKAAVKAAAAAPRATTPVGSAAANAASQFPHTIAAQLKTHHVVVVLLYDPKAKVDSYSLAEAQLGAKNVDAGFLRVDVLDAHQATPFTKAYGVLQDPTLLLFKRPGTLAFKLAGFADHDTVAQAAKNAALGLTSVEPS